VEWCQPLSQQHLPRRLSWASLLLLLLLLLLLRLLLLWLLLLLLLPLPPPPVRRRCPCTRRVRPVLHAAVPQRLLVNVK